MALRPLRLLDNQRPSLSINRELKNIRLNLSPFFFFSIVYTRKSSGKSINISLSMLSTARQLLINHSFSTIKREMRLKDPP